VIEFLLTANLRLEEEAAIGIQLPKLNSQKQVDGNDPLQKSSSLLPQMFLGRIGARPEESEQTVLYTLSEDEVVPFFPVLHSMDIPPPVVTSKRPQDLIDGTQSVQCPSSKRGRIDHFELDDFS
jgi:hypothetical protein